MNQIFKIMLNIWTVLMQFIGIMFWCSKLTNMMLSSPQTKWLLLNIEYITVLGPLTLLLKAKNDTACLPYLYITSTKGEIHVIHLYNTEISFQMLFTKYWLNNGNMLQSF